MLVKTNGLYWMHISITVPASTSAYVCLSGTTNYIRISQSHGGFNRPDTISRNGVVDIQAGTQLRFISNFTSLGLQWTSFRLDNSMSPLVLFQVARSSTAISSGQIIYDLVFTNIGSAWTTLTNAFQAPRTGQYFFSLSVGMSSKQDFNLLLLVNGVSVLLAQSGSDWLISKGYNLMSASKLLTLTAGDIVTAKFQNGNIYSESTNLQISLAGFHYNPFINSKVGDN